jgi:CII-binding regulator of phage lambda lysogenization HflD
MKVSDKITAKDGSVNGTKEMSDVINIKDFYDHETRISIVENAIIHIDRRFDQVDRQFEQIERRFEQVERRFDQVDRRIDRLEEKMDSQFKWVIGCIGGLSLTTITTLATVIMLVIKFH